MACVSVSVASAQFDRTNAGFNLDFNLDGGLNEDKPTTTPIPILRYVDTQNPDGSYTFGYESGDGTYKIETRYTNGEVKGKYGYYDDTGLFREVQYGATTENGFEPTGTGLNLPEVRTAIEKPEAVAADAVTLVNGRRANVVRRRRPQPNVVEQVRSRPTEDRRTQLPANRRRQRPTELRLSSTGGFLSGL